MGKFQNRRSTSMNALVYARLKAHCKRRGLPIAAFVEAVLTDALDDEGEPVPTVAPPGYPTRRHKPEAIAQDLASRPPAHVTW